MHPDDEPAAPLCAIIVYDKGVAYRRALRMLVGLDRLVGGGINVRIIPWRLKEFDFADHRALAIENARAADMVVISVAGTIELPETLRQWLVDCASYRDGRSTLLIVALLSSLEGMDLPESARLQLIKRTANEAGFAFLAPEMNRGNLSPEVIVAAGANEKIYSLS